MTFSARSPSATASGMVTVEVVLIGVVRPDPSVAGASVSITAVKTCEPMSGLLVQS